MLQMLEDCEAGSYRDKWEKPGTNGAVAKVTKVAKVSSPRRTKTVVSSTSSSSLK